MSVSDNTCYFERYDVFRYISKNANIFGHLCKTWRWCRAADLQLHLTIPAPFCASLSRLARRDNTKMCERVRVGEGGGVGLSHLDESCAVCVDSSGKDG